MYRCLSEDELMGADDIIMYEDGDTLPVLNPGWHGQPVHNLFGWAGTGHRYDIDNDTHTTVAVLRLE